MAGFLGSPKVRQYTGKCLIRREGHHLAGEGRSLGKVDRTCKPSSFRLVPAPQSESTWTKTHIVNSVQWAPHEVGAVLACASSDGKVSVLEFKEDGSWDTKVFQAHAIGCNAASWAPATSPGSIVQTSGSSPSASGTRRFVTGGSDNLVKIWSWKYGLCPKFP